VPPCRTPSIRPSVRRSHPRGAETAAPRSAPLRRPGNGGQARRGRASRTPAGSGHTWLGRPPPRGDCEAGTRRGRGRGAVEGQGRGAADGRQSGRRVEGTEQSGEKGQRGPRPGAVAEERNPLAASRLGPPGAPGRQGHYPRTTWAPSCPWERQGGKRPQLCIKSLRPSWELQIR
jgi:hypothetical protein